MRIVVERIEGELVLCETPQGEILSLPRKLFSQELKEGDICEYTTESAQVLKTETQRRREDILQRFTRLKKKK